MAKGELPKYRTIADDLLRRIDAGEFGVGSRLPAQSSLAAGYGVTLMTLRQAVGELERQGVVRAAPGKGTFVADRRAISFGLDRLSSFAQEMSQQGVDVATEVLVVERPSQERDAVRARAEVAEWSEVDLVTVTRRRSIGDRPVVVQRSTMPSDTWDRIASVDLGATSLYDAMASQAGHRVERASESIRAVVLDDADAALLDAAVRSAALESVRVSFDDGIAFLVDHAVMLGSATEIRAERSADDLRLGYTTPD